MVKKITKEEEYKCAVAECDKKATHIEIKRRVPLCDNHTVLNIHEFLIGE